MVVKKVRRETSSPSCGSSASSLSKTGGLLLLLLLLYKLCVRLGGFESNAVVVAEEADKCVVDDTQAWHGPVVMMQAQHNKVTPDETGRRMCIVAASKGVIVEGF